MARPNKADPWRWTLETSISALALFTAFVSVAMGVHSAYETHETNRLSVLPNVTIFLHFDGGHNDRFSSSGLKFWNTGIGPAVVKAFRVTVDGREVRTWKEMAERLGLDGAGTTRATILSQGRFIVVGPAEDLFYILGEEKLATHFMKEHARVGVDLCYCSVYEQCWITSYGVGVRGPRSVERCPADQHFNVF